MKIKKGGSCLAWRIEKDKGERGIGRKDSFEMEDWGGERRGCFDRGESFEQKKWEKKKKKERKKKKEFELRSWIFLRRK